MDRIQNREYILGPNCWYCLFVLFLADSRERTGNERLTSLSVTVYLWIVGLSLIFPSKHDNSRKQQHYHHHCYKIKMDTTLIIGSYFPLMGFKSHNHSILPSENTLKGKKMTDTSGRETGEGLTSTTDWHKIDAACVEQTEIAKVRYGKSEWQTSPPRQLEAILLAVFLLPYFFIEWEKKKKSMSGFGDKRPEKCIKVYLICINIIVAPCSYCLFPNACLHSPLFFI